MAVSKTRSKKVVKSKEEKPQVPDAPVKDNSKVEKELQKPELKNEEKVVASKSVKKKEVKALVFKNKVDDIVQHEGHDWKVLVVVDKKGKERLMIECRGQKKSVWASDLD